MKNCKNGGKTIIDPKDGPDSDPYRCQCARGYSGDLCEIGRYNFCLWKGEKNIPRKGIKTWKMRYQFGE